MSKILVNVESTAAANVGNPSKCRKCIPGTWYTRTRYVLQGGLQTTDVGPASTRNRWNLHDFKPYRVNSTRNPARPLEVLIIFFWEYSRNEDERESRVDLAYRECTH